MLNGDHASTNSLLDSPVVHVVDDDLAHLEAASCLLTELEFTVRTFHSGHEFLSQHDWSQPGCALIDVVMPEIDGIDVQRSLFRDKLHRPHIMVSGHADVPMAVEVMSKGATGFLLKPYRVHELLSNVRKALQQDREQRRNNAEQQAAEKRMEQLTDRERQVLNLVLEGEPNKRIAKLLDISQRTVELHRSNVMKKCDARSLAELFHFALRANLIHA